LPISIATKHVVGSYLTPDLVTPAEGRLRFVPSAAVYDVTGNIVVAPSPLYAVLDPVDGSFAIDLMVTDDIDANPQDWVWLVTELIPDGREFAIQVPSASPSTVALADLTPVVDVDLRFAYATVASLEAVNARMDALEIEGGVKHCDVFTSSGNWVCPTGVYAVDLEVVGAGGGGGGGGGSAGGYGSGASISSGVRGGGGGSGGGIGIRRFIESVPVSPGVSYPVVIGAAGAGGVGGSGGPGGAGSNPGTDGGTGGAGSAGGATSALGYKSAGGLPGAGGTGVSATSILDYRFAVSGGAYGGGAGSDGGTPSRGGHGGSFGQAGEARLYDGSNYSDGGVANLLGIDGDLAGGGAGGGSGRAGTRGGGGKATPGVLGGTGGAPGADVSPGGGGATIGDIGVQGEGGDAADHPGGGGHGGGGASGPGQGASGNGGSGATGGTGGAGGPGVVRISY
jgi:hypothetical protein